MSSNEALTLVSKAKELLTSNQGKQVCVSTLNNYIKALELLDEAIEKLSSST